MTRIVFASVALALAVLTPLVGAAPAAAAPAPGDPGADAAVVWAVRPADASGPDGRRWVERELDPGASATEHLAVTNLGDAPVSFEVNAADGYFTDAGRFSMLPGGTASTGAGQWISAPPAVTVDPGATAIVPFTITVPAGATPGDHAAGVAVSVPSSSAAGGTAVAVESRVGFRVMVRVAGEVAPGLDVSSAAVAETSWNPLRPGSAVVTLIARNTGNVRLMVAPHVAGAGPALAAADESPDADAPGDRSVELLPGDTRTFEMRVADVWPLGWQTLPVVVDQALVLPDGTTRDLDSVTHAAGVWALPWPQLLVLVGIALLVVGIAQGRRRRGDHVRRLVAEAHERGRREGAEALPRSS
ncbi:DUF916 domain-containing protein [Microbacterium sp. W1N]|uniref:DUF916 domain-containing protein n=1 Tax=Microbacterium festucae TaxID=2977531 RepID=UPI0021BE077C|nr:DUF916 domain-containing protein [Microbacterium festucae]MCT9820515.1 DUF916 domain-containing protein [Microbacterium festucae]